ncbi:hypothetical protein OAK55_01465, partial [Akkermansiaceae bacterium]|nr:hypothetical protein [Akkermansiaceae bacterium]
MTQDVFSSGNKKSNPRFPLGCFVAVLRCAGASYLPGITPTLSKLPKTWNGFAVIDGDESDLRFLDGTGKVVGL